MSLTDADLSVGMLVEAYSLRRAQRTRMREEQKAAAARAAAYFNPGDWTSEADWWALQLGHRIDLKAS